MEFENPAENTALPRAPTPQPAPDNTQAAVEKLIAAIYVGDLASFENIMNENDAAFSSDVLNKHEILRKAVCKFRLEMVHMLLNRENKPDIDAIDKAGYTPVMWAIMIDITHQPPSEKYEIIDSLMTAGANTKLPFPNGLSPWGLAVAENDLQIAQLFAKHRVDPNVVDGNGMTPIGTAASTRGAEMVDLLIKTKADVNLFLNTSPIFAPLITALGREQLGSHTPETIKILKSIVAAGAKIYSRSINRYHEDDNLLDILAGGDIDTEDSRGSTARKQLLEEMKGQTSDSTDENNLSLEIAENKFDAGHLNLGKILLGAIADSEEKKAFISNRMNTAVEQGKYLEWDLMQELGGVFDAKLHTETEAPAVGTVKDAQKETSKTPSKEEIFKEILEEISNKAASKIYPEEIALKRFFNDEFPQHELNSEKYCKTIPEKYQGDLKTSVDKAFFTALMAGQLSPSHLETILLAKVSFDYLDPAMDDAPLKTGEPYAIETAAAQAPADSMEPPAPEDNIGAGLIACTPEY